MYICLSCFNHYDENLINLERRSSYNYICPVKNCRGNVVELDELIAPTIIELNKKGYITNFCCSGHWYEDCYSPYISFHNENMIPSEIPDSFIKDRDSVIRGLGSPGIKTKKDFKDTYEKYKHTLEINDELYKWALSLPKNPFFK